MTWDPHGLLDDSQAGSKQGLIAHRLEKRRRRLGHVAEDVPKLPANMPIQPAPADVVRRGGVSIADAPRDTKGPTFGQHIGFTYMPIDEFNDRIRVRSRAVGVAHCGVC